MNPHGNPTPDEVWEKRKSSLREYYVGQDLTFRQICNIYDIDERTLSHWLRRFGLSRPVRRGSRHKSWKGGKWLHGAGYIIVGDGQGGGSLEHRLVAERMLGRKLRADEVVHHHDGNRTNNSEENLVVLTRAKHASLRWTDGYHAGRTDLALEFLAHALIEEI